MNSEPSRLETLPNEIFIEIFQYLDIESLFRAFDKLNNRLNELLRAINNLVYYLWDYNYNKMNVFTPYIDTLIVGGRKHTMLNDFRNIRHLKIMWLTADLLNQLDTVTLPVLERLFIKHINYDFADILYKKIFTNTFPYLKSCCICQNSEIKDNKLFIYLPLLYRLQIGLIDLSIYQLILSFCPNLNVFEFRLRSSEISINGKPNTNLRRMIIKAEEANHIKYDSMINACLSYAPSLERLRIDQYFCYTNIPQYIIYDWHAKFIARDLPLLRRYSYYLNASYLVSLDAQIINTFDEMKKNFTSVHSNRYKSKFHLNLMC